MALSPRAPSCPASCRASTTLIAANKTWMAGTSPAMTKSRRLHQGIDREDAVFPHDQRIDLGLGDRRIILQRQPRQRHDCLGERIEVAGRLAAEAFQRGEGFHLVD